MKRILFSVCVLWFFCANAASGQGPQLSIAIEKDKIRVRGATSVLVTVTGLSQEYFEDGATVEVTLRITNPLAAAWTSGKDRTGGNPITKLAITGIHVGRDGTYTRRLSLLGIGPGPYQVTGKLALLTAEDTVEAEVVDESEQVKDEEPQDPIPDGVYRVVEVKGTSVEQPIAEIHKSDPGWKPLKPGDLVKDGDELVAGYGTTILLMDNKGSRILMHPLSTVTLPTNQSEIPSEVKLEFGKIEIELRESGLKTDLKIKLPTGSIGIRGTHLSVSHEKGSAESIILLRKGAITVTAGSEYRLIDARFNPGKVSRIRVVAGEVRPAEVIDLVPDQWMLN